MKYNKINDIFIDTELPEPLTPEEFHICFKKMKSGDMKARDKIIKHNMKLVIKKVKQEFSGMYYDLDELTSVGLFWLIKSVDTFDINKGTQFSTYSAKCVRNGILNFIRDNKKYIINDVSLNQNVVRNKKCWRLKLNDILPEPNSDLIAEYETKELYGAIRKIIKDLPEIDKESIILYFGFKDNYQLTQYQIADRLNINQSTVSRALLRGLRKIKFRLMAEKMIEIGQNDIVKSKTLK